MGIRGVALAAGIAAATVAAGVVIARQRARRDRVILGLGAALASSRQSEGRLQERVGWLSAAVDGGFTPLRLVPGGTVQAPRRSPSAARMS